jgi:hypothetical protein
MTPTTPRPAITDDDLDALDELEDAAESFEAPDARPSAPILRTVGAAPGSPCPRCGTPLEVDRNVLYDTIGRTTEPVVVLRCRINGHTFRETPLPA